MNFEELNSGIRTIQCPNLPVFIANRRNKALKDLCEIMNSEVFCFPQTSLRMVFEAPPVAFEIDACQGL